MARVLVIEDEVDVTKVLGKRLTDAGHEPILANEASKGVELAHEMKPDAIILDLMLPAGGGLSILRGLKLSPDTRDIPVIVLTGVRNEQVKHNVMKEGASVFLQKPYEPSELMAVISKFTQKKNGKK